MGNTLKVPATTEHVIRLKKVSGTDRVFRGRCNKPFFQEGYPTPKTFRDRFSQDAWNRLDNEFLNVWNSTLASNTSWEWKAYALCPGLILLCVPICYVANMAKRDKAMYEVVAKANKYIFRPRGMYMKERVIAEGSDSSREEIAWYEIALTPWEVSRLENAKTYQVGCNCCGDPNDYVTEDTVEEDLDFQRRWSGGPEGQAGGAGGTAAEEIIEKFDDTKAKDESPPVYNENPIFNAR